MLNASILDSYILSLLERGLETPYELQRQGGLSLGASTPALRRLLKAKLVTRDEKASATNRPRHVYKVTRSGGETARLAWKPFLGTENLPPDLDSVLRIIDLATYYRADRGKIAAFVTRAANQRRLLAEQSASARSYDTEGIAHLTMRNRFDGDRWSAEALALHDLAKQVVMKASHKPRQIPSGLKAVTKGLGSLSIRP
jgi:DNA-binding PadR family transcriptional regulator